MKRLRDIFTLASRLKYLIWRGLNSKKPITVQLRAGLQLIIRPAPTTDADVAYQIFVASEYEFPFLINPAAVHLIVDLGGNVGYTVLYFGHKFPKANIVVFEPHPEHVRQIREHIAINSLIDRVLVRAEAAGCTSGSIRLTDDGSCSLLTLEDRRGSIQVPVVDWFSAVGEQAIDLLKIDIEGSEYGILEDPRFAALDVEYLVMEWHEFSGENRSSEALVSRLRNLNYELICLPAVQGANGMMVGMVFGRRLKELTGRPSS